MSSFNPLSLNQHDGPKVRRADPDDTMGRAIYRGRAEAEARRSISMARKVSLRPLDDPTDPA